jgi:hypothetical protein
MDDVACQLASEKASDLAAPLAKHGRAQTNCVSTQQRLAQAQAELATIQQGQHGTQAANKVLALHDA